MNLIQPVKSADAVERIFCVAPKVSSGTEKHHSKQSNVILEMGLHSALKGPIKQTMDALHQQQSDQRQQQFTYHTSSEGGKDDEEALLDLSKNLFCLGSTIQLSAVNQTDHHNAHVLTDLPSYAGDKSTRYILGSRIIQAKLHPGQSYHLLLRWKGPYTEGGEVSFRQVFTLEAIPWIRDHNSGGQVIFLMTCYLPWKLLEERLLLAFQVY